MCAVSVPWYNGARFAQIAYQQFMHTHPHPYRPGTIHRHAHVHSRYVEPRHVDVWLPPGYYNTPSQHYPVIYMHDGQNLFDPALSYAGVDWGIDTTITQLMQHEQLPGLIVVGIWNSPERLREYMPARMLFAPHHRMQLSQFVRQYGGPPLSQHYLAFLVTELKPLIDATYRTRPDQRHTFVMGSSMGGLISLDAITEYPHIFGGAGCVSIHWPIGRHELVEYFGAVLPHPADHKLYFDYGTEGVDSTYEPFQHHMDALLLRAGYQPDHDWMTCRYDGADHNEAAWRERVHVPLRFLLHGLRSETR